MKTCRHSGQCRHRFTLAARRDQYRYSNILPEDILKYKDAKSLFGVMAIGVKEILIKYPDHRSVRKYPILSSTDWAKEDRAEYDKIVSYTPGFDEMSEISHENQWPS